MDKKETKTRDRNRNGEKIFARNISQKFVHAKFVGSREHWISDFFITVCIPFGSHMCNVQCWILLFGFIPLLQCRFYPINTFTVFHLSVFCLAFKQRHKIHSSRFPENGKFFFFLVVGAEAIWYERTILNGHGANFRVCIQFTLTDQCSNSSALAYADYSDVEYASGKKFTYHKIQFTVFNFLHGYIDRICKSAVHHQTLMWMLYQVHNFLNRKCKKKNEQLEKN